MVQVITDGSQNLANRVGVRYSVSIAVVEGKGRCLIANEMISAGEVIEIAPTIIIDRAERVDIDKTALTNFYFNLGRTTDCTDLHSFDGCLALGVATVCNHSRTPNAECVVVSNSEGFFFVLSSLRRIVPGEEICIKYRDPWFEYVPPTYQAESSIGKVNEA